MGKSVHKQTYHYYLTTDAWKRKRSEVLERDGGKCTHCGSTDRLHVHHVTYERIFDERPEDLITLCAGCHEMAHAGQDAPKRPASWMDKFRRGDAWRLDPELLERATDEGKYYCDEGTWMLGFSAADKCFYIHFGSGDARRHVKLAKWPDVSVNEARLMMLEWAYTNGWDSRFSDIDVARAEAMKFFGVDANTLEVWRRSKDVREVFRGWVRIDETLLANRGPIDPPSRCFAEYAAGGQCLNPSRRTDLFCANHKWKGCKHSFEQMTICCRSVVPGTEYCQGHIVDRLRELEAMAGVAP